MRLRAAETRPRRLQCRFGACNRRVDAVAGGRALLGAGGARALECAHRALNGAARRAHGRSERRGAVTCASQRVERRSQVGTRTPQIARQIGAFSIVDGAAAAAQRVFEALDADERRGGGRRALRHVEERQRGIVKRSVAGRRVQRVVERSTDALARAREATQRAGQRGAGVVRRVAIAQAHGAARALRIARRVAVASGRALVAVAAAAAAAAAAASSRAPQLPVERIGKRAAQTTIAP